MNILDNLSRILLPIGAIFLLLAFSGPTPMSSASSIVDNYSPTGIVIPLYTYPSSSTWDVVAKVKQTYPNVPIMAIVNPDSGPGSNYDQNYVTGIQLLRNAGVIVLGYVATGFASNSISSVERQVNEYLQWYPDINGIMFDQMSDEPGNENYYSTLNSYVKSIGMNESFGNAGTSVPSSFIGTMDVICINEGSTLLSVSSLQSRTMGYPKSNFAYIQYGSSLPNQSFITDLSTYVQWIYFTDATLPNPYNTLPSYFTQLVSNVSSIDSRNYSISSSKIVPVRVTSAFINGTTFSGMRTHVEINGTIIKGYTPFTFNATMGTTYTIGVDNYQNYVFDHWASGSTNSIVTVTPTQAMNLTAYYDDVVSSTTTTSSSVLASSSSTTSQIVYTASSYSITTTSSSALTNTTYSVSKMSTTSTTSASSYTKHVPHVSSSSTVGVTSTSTTATHGKGDAKANDSKISKGSILGLIPFLSAAPAETQDALSILMVVISISTSTFLVRQTKRTASRRKYDRGWRW